MVTSTGVCLSLQRVVEAQSRLRRDLLTLLTLHKLVSRRTAEAAALVKLRADLAHAQPGVAPAASQAAADAAAGAVVNTLSLARNHLLLTLRRATSPPLSLAPQQPTLPACKPQWPCNTNRHSATRQHTTPQRRLT